jgi:hypothetical protein
LPKNACVEMKLHNSLAVSESGHLIKAERHSVKGAFSRTITEVEAKVDFLLPTILFYL